MAGTQELYAGGSVATPLAGYGALFLDSGYRIGSKDNSGNIYLPRQATTRAASAALSGTTETIISQALVIPVGLLQVGTVIRGQGSGVCTTTVANVSTFTLRAGTLGSTSDQSIFTFTVTAGSTGTGVAFDFEFVVAIDATGATGTCKGWSKLAASTTTGISNALYTRSQVAGTNLATTTATNIELTYKSAAATTASTFDAALTLEILAL